MNDKLVSAIITTHNRAPDIVQRAINSIVKQTYRNIEIIVVDDSSPTFVQREEVERTVRRISDKIEYIRLESSKGACAARNTGLQHSNGYYVAFLDDDDEWLPEKIEEQIKGFADTHYALVYGGIIVVDDIRSREYMAHYNIQSGNIFYPLLKMNIIGTTSNPLINKYIIEDVGGFDVLMQSSQDLDLWLRITKDHLVKYIDSPMIKYHIHSGERISTSTEKKISGMERINSKYSEFIEDNNEIWYFRHIILIPYYLKKYGRMKTFITWINCVIKQPFKLLNNFKYLFMIIIGIDLYTMISEIVHEQ